MNKFLLLRKNGWRFTFERKVSWHEVGLPNFTVDLLESKEGRRRSRSRLLIDSARFVFKRACRAREEKEETTLVSANICMVAAGDRLNALVKLLPA